VKNATYAVKNTMESCWRDIKINSQHNRFAILLGEWQIKASHFKKWGPFVNLECSSKFLLSNDEFIAINSLIDNLQFCIFFIGKKQKIQSMH